jgi:tripartite ATP-independent transporter DctP family solute receptor
MKGTTEETEDMDDRFRVLTATVATVVLAAGTASVAVGQDPVEITLAHSYQDEQPQHACGAQVIADDVAAADVGVTVEIFGASQLGGDADRIASVAAGDIDMDIQGSSALAALYPPIGVADGAFVFDDADHLKRYFTDPVSDPLKEGFLETTGVRILGAWSAGARDFTANKPIRTPEDLVGLRMRFPPSPQFLMNAAAMGADATEVAFEELYLALSQGTVDGQENPVNIIAANNLFEVQDYLSLSEHQLNSNLVVVNEAFWQSLSEEQQAAVNAAVANAMDQVPACDADFTAQQLDEWRENGAIEVIDDVDRQAFRDKAVPYLAENFTPEQAVVLEAIRSVAADAGGEEAAESMAPEASAEAAG